VTRISYRSDGADSPVPFAPRFLWCPYERGSVLFSDGLGPILQVYDYGGNLLKEIKSPLPEPEKVTKKDLDQWRNRRKENARDKDWYQRFGTVIEKYKKSIHEFKPNLGNLSLTPDGNILVEGDAGEEEEITDYWLLDKNGKILVHGRTDTAGLNITQNFLFYGVMDEYGGIRFYVQKRSGSEIQDLAKFLK
jgi:hypothetical protein